MHWICRLTLILGLVSGFLVAPAVAWAAPILYEVLYDGQGADADDVFTEIYGMPGTSLDGWSLRGINGSTGATYRTVSLTGAVIPSDGLLVIGTSSAAGTVLLARDFTARVDWQNGPDAVQLLDASGAVIDALQYGDAGSYGAGEGAFAPDVLAGWSLTRDLLATDTDDNAYDFAPSSTPTPGIGPIGASPEPCTLFLVAAGGVGLVGVRRRARQREPRTET